MSRPWMPLYVADYLADTAHLRAAESGAYLHLIMHYWQHGSLPNDDRLLATIARMATEEWQQCRNIVSALFQPEWRHKRIDKELAEAKKRYERRAAAGHKSAEARAARAAEAEIEQCTNNVQAAPVVVSSSLASSSEIIDSNEGRKKKSGDTRAREVASTDDWPTDYRAQFWLKYPNKIGKPKALAKLELARKRGVPWGELWGGLLRYVGKTDDRPWCNPETWINQERWTDEPADGQIQNGRPTRNGPGKRTVQQAAADQLEQLQSLTRPAPSDLCDGAVEIPLRRISSG